MRVPDCKQWIKRQCAPVQGEQPALNMEHVASGWFDLSGACWTAFAAPPL